MSDTPRDLAQAIGRKLADCGCPDPDTVALEVIAIARGHGWGRRILPPPDWQHGGAGVPTPGSEAAALLAEYRARQDAGHG